MMEHDDFIHDNIDGKRVLCGVSGGKDSTATALYLIRELKIDVELYFTDTGWEHPDTYKYLDYLQNDIFKQEITTIKPALSFEELVIKKKIFPSRRIRYCTQLLKIKPFQDYYNLKENGKGIVSCLGERSEESLSRANKQDFIYDGQLGSYIWLPIKSWRWEQVFEIAEKHNVKPNPLYKRGFKRVGCFPCIFANKPDYLAMSKDPFSKERIEKIKELEEKTGYGFVHLLRTHYEINGIDSALKWAGSEQVDMFEDTKNNSCSSHYKLCE